ncbi:MULTISPECIES: MOSC domain-containing protein [Streptosporangium]|uniref:MOSC domain-containing protein YiiM n=1 Tax=Streptosporangium brasiliense TaxID=47480 RepID=A0ABT9R558_9ACTN|nr:MOSC domain-containing protein [Streptosporangium brasiliense]MDP9864358.1 MOSC domain-containing protein YiiM [Streptosporangium brasiliense]
MSRLLSVNLAHPHSADYTSADLTGIDKRPADGPVAVAAPGPMGTAGSGVAGDTIGDLRDHGGDHQAVYAYAREDLDTWEKELGRELSNGVFGENLTTSGLDVNGALVGERWRIGTDLILEVTSARIPCRTFAGWLDRKGWVRRFTEAALPGAYLRVIAPGEIQAGDVVEVVSRPDHAVTVEFLFRALTTEAGLLPRLLDAGDALNPYFTEKIHRRLAGRSRNV